MNKNKSKTSGLTLVEIMVATAIFAIVTAGAFGTLVQGFNLAKGSRHYTRVSQIVQSEYEFLRSLSWVELTSLATSETLTPSSSLDPKFFDPYTIERDIITVSSTLRRVEISVTFDAPRRNGGTLTLRYVTFFTQGGLNDYYYRKI